MAEPAIRVRKRTPSKRALDLPPKVSDDSAEGFLFVKRTAYKREEQHEEKVRVPDLAAVLKGAPPAVVRVGGSVTKNLGDYNSARVEVMLELPCLPEVGEMRRVADLLSAQLDELIPAELAKAMDPGA